MCLENKKPNWQQDTRSITDYPNDVRTPGEDKEPAHAVNSDHSLHVTRIFCREFPVLFVTDCGYKHENIADNHAYHWNSYQDNQPEQDDNENRGGCIEVQDNFLGS